MWVKVDDQFPDHPKVAAAGPAAAWLFVCGLCYCNRMLTDGFIPAGQIDKLVPHTPDRPVEDAPHRLAERLCQVGLLDEHERRGMRGFVIHDYLKFQPSRKQVLAERTRGAKRQAAWRGRHITSNGDRNEQSNGSSNEENNEPRNRPVTLAPYPVPDPEEQKTDARARETLTDSDRASEDARVLLEPVETMSWFDKVYAIYPNKDRKVDANRAWIELSPDLATVQAIFTDVSTRVAAGWKKYERRFIPQLRNYLMERMWEDAPTGMAAIYEDDPYTNLPHAWQCRRCGGVHEGTAEQEKRRDCLKVKAS